MYMYIICVHPAIFERGRAKMPTPTVSLLKKDVKPELFIDKIPNSLV
jgi:hypothetical protein